MLKESISSVRSNLDRFLYSVTPTIPSRTLPQSCLHELNSQWQPNGKELTEYFTLRDLWDCYDEWSAYGVGVPLQLNGGEIVMQYYVPSLSAIQLYTTNNKSISVSRNRREDNDVAEFESDSWSDDSGSDNLSRSLSNNSSRGWDAVSADSCFDQDGSWTMKDKLGYLCFHYVEVSSPYWRHPLTLKIAELAQHYPALMTLKNVDLLPASWMAISWYPIYHIPSQKNDKDLLTCFLTFHTLSSYFQDTEEGFCENNKETNTACVPLSPFGLASYKMQGDTWLKQQTSDHEQMAYLYYAADSWLKQLGVHHHDFNFFSLHSAV